MKVFGSEELRHQKRFYISIFLFLYWERNNFHLLQLILEVIVAKKLYIVGTLDLFVFSLLASNQLQRK